MSVTPIRHADRCPGDPVCKDAVCLRPLPTAEQLKEQEREYRDKLARTTSHELARQLLELPEAKMIFVQGTGSEYTHDFYVASAPWHADGLGQIRMMITDGTVEVARDNG